MDNILSIRLEAHNDAANHHRVYVVMVGRDLFKRWSLRICYGRSGQRLRELHFSGADEKKMQRLARAHLRRRLSAPRRIGCAYRVHELTAAEGRAISDWISYELMTKLFVASDTS